jgi:eukaryotic-like serine/threonine-protein kinase
VTAENNEAPVAIGELIAGKYRVERVLGHGGMGVVVAAMHTELDQRVALKFLLSEAMTHPDVVARFSREAKAAASIHSEHVARVIDVGSLPSGAPYVVMEYMDGEDLARVLARRGPLPAETAVGYVLEACEAIAEAHAQGIVHRDLKPANVLINDEGLLKIVDFGVAAAQREGDTQLTKTGYVIGSPKYMAPEQILGRKVDERADVYALGVMMYEMLTGIPPYSRGDHMAVMYQHVQGKARAPQEINPTLSANLAEVVVKAMAVDKAKRFQTMEEYRGALERFL